MFIAAEEHNGAVRGKLAAVILAAGRSSRMGRFKPLLPLAGVSAVERAIDLFRRAGVSDVTVVVGHRADDLQPVVQRRHATCVVNRNYEQGMCSSVAAGIAALPGDVAGCFLLPVDMPLVRSRTITRLGDNFDGRTPVLYPSFRGQRGHPPLISNRLFSAVLQAGGKDSLKRILAQHEAEAAEVDVLDESIQLDMDTPDDYAALCERAARADRPSPAECEAILTMMRLPAPVLRHLRAVADVAGRLAGSLVARGVPLDADLVVAASLLHDLGKGSPDHAALGAYVLEALGYPRVARLIACHSDVAFGQQALDESAIVYLADKLVEGDRPVSITERFTRSMVRFADDPEAMQAATARLQTAQAVAGAVEAALGMPIATLLSHGEQQPSPAAANPARPRHVRPVAVTQSVCPVCLRRIEAERVAEGTDVYLLKTCPQHGAFRSIVWRGAPAYAAWGTAGVKPAPMTPRTTAATRGCPYDCGLCPEHRQQSCCVLLEVTQRCNLACPICFASAGRQVADPTLTEIDGWLQALRAGGRPVNIQLSGGEPTLRDDLPTIVALAHAYGFDFVQVNTNGLRIAEDRSYLERLKRAGVDCVFLQFDGLTPEVYRRIRGRDLLAEKKAALDNCAALRLGVILVPVLVPGVNSMQIGDLVRFAIARMPTVRAVHFQPVSYVGRTTARPEDADRITIPEVLTQIELQTGGAIRAADFKPGTAENPYCSFNGAFLIQPGPTVTPLRPSSGSCCGRADGDEAQRARRFVAKRWAAPAARTSCCSSMKVESLDAFLEERQHTLCISGMAFQDAWTLDLERLRQCYIHVAGSEGRLVPLCAYNLSSVSGETLYRRPGA